MPAVPNEFFSGSDDTTYIKALFRLANTQMLQGKIVNLRTDRESAGDVQIQS